MNTIKTTLTTEARFSDDGLKRYLLRKTWDPKKPKLTIIMLAPSAASGIELDTTTQLCLNNSSRLGYGSVNVVNLFATLNDFALKQAEGEDPENLSAIVEAAEEADLVVYAPGVGKAKLLAFQERSTQVLEALRPFEKKLRCLTNASGKAKFLHPLCPSVRFWGNLAEFSVSELLSNNPIESTAQPKKKGRPLVIKKEASA
jgi:hypothetical protein